MTSNKGSNSSEEEDVQLCKSFLHISKSPIVGTNMERLTMWERIHTHFYKCFGKKNLPVDDQASVDVVIEDPKRNQESLQNRWGTIQRFTLSWAGIFNDVKKSLSSGKGELDAESMAKKVYSVRNKGKKFNLGHCMEILKDEEKWNATDKKTTKKTVVVRQSSSVSSAPATPATDGSIEVEISESEDELPRPVGRKKAKAQEKSKRQTQNFSNTLETIEKSSAERHEKVMLEMQMKRDLEQKKVDLEIQKYEESKKQREENEKRRNLDRDIYNERIMSVDIESLKATNPGKALYYKKMQDKILNEL